jgi:hypothetical protein
MRRSGIFFIATVVVTAGLPASGFAGVAAAEELLDKKQFVKAANARCKKMHKAIDANFEEQFAGLEEDAEPSPAQVEAGVARLIEILGGAATDVEALQGPAALEEKVDAFLDRFNAVVDKFETDPQSAFAEELSGYPFAKPDKIARRIGLKECVQRQR